MYLRRFHIIYNKRNVQKINDKKVLHKIKKQWVVVSLAVLMALGGGAIATTSTHAAVKSNDNNLITRNIQSQAKNLHSRIVLSNARHENKNNPQIATYKGPTIIKNGIKKGISKNNKISPTLNNTQKDSSSSSNKNKNKNSITQKVASYNAPKLKNSGNSQNSDTEKYLQSQDQNGNKIVLIIDNQGVYRPYLVRKPANSSTGVSIPGFKKQLYFKDNKLEDNNGQEYQKPSTIGDNTSNKFYVFDARTSNGGSGWELNNTNTFSETFHPHTDFFSGDKSRYGDHYKYLGTDSLSDERVSAPSVTINNVYDGDPVLISINNLGSYNHFRNVNSGDATTSTLSDASAGHHINTNQHLIAIANHDNFKSSWINGQSHFSVISTPAPAVTLNYYNEDNHSTVYSSGHSIDGYYFDPIPETNDFDNLTYKGSLLQNFYQPDNWVQYYFGTNPTSTLNLSLAGGTLQI